MLENTGDSDLSEKITVFKKSDLNDFLNKKVGLSVDDIDIFEFTIYSPTYDVYYIIHNSANYTQFTCTDGTVTTNDEGNEIYCVTFVPMLAPDRKSIAILEKDGDDYKIQSCETDICRIYPGKPLILG